MKKISLKDVKNGLKRDEMRMILGGGGCGQCISCSGNSSCGSGVCAFNHPACPSKYACL